MRFSVLKQNLEYVASKMAAIVSVKAIKPILFGALIEVEDGKIKVSATDMETSVKMSLGESFLKEKAHSSSMRNCWRKWRRIPFQTKFTSRSKRIASPIARKIPTMTFHLWSRMTFLRSTSLKRVRAFPFPEQF